MLLRLEIMAVFIFYVYESLGILDFPCPHSSQWNIRSRSFCHNTSSKYSCLYSDGEEKHMEDCTISDYVGPGYRFGWLNELILKHCKDNKYNPFIMYTNTSGDCMLLKSECSELGQIMYENGRTTKDRSCRCDYAAGFAFIVKPSHPCFCIPSEEDCSCIIKTCAVGSVLSPDYECISNAGYTGHFSCPEQTAPDFPLLGNDTETSKNTTTSHVLDSTFENQFISHHEQLHKTVAKGITVALVLLIIVGGAVLFVGKEEDKFVRELKDKKIFRRRPVKMVLDEMHIYDPKSIFCFIGPAGSGTSTLMHHVALHLHEDYGYAIIKATSPLDISKKHKANRKEVFVFDNIYGRYTFNPILFDNWNIMSNAIEGILSSQTVKIMTSSKSIIANNLPFEIQIFLNTTVDLLAPEYALSKMEVEEMAQMFLPEEKASLLRDAKLRNEECFPLMCHLSSLSERHDTDIFTNMYQFIQSEIDRLSKDLILRCILVLFVLSENNVSEKMPFPVDKNSFLSDFAIKENTNVISWNTITKNLTSLKSDLFKRSGNSYVTIHDTIFDTLVTHIGAEYVDLVIQYANPSIIRERFHFGTVTQVAEENFIQIPLNKENLYFDRLCSDIVKGYAEIVFTNRMLKFKSFSSKFLIHIKTHTEAIKKIANLRNTCKSPLMLCSLQGYSNIVKWLLKDMNYDVNMTDDAGRSPLYLASEYGHRETVKILLECGCDLNICRTDKGRKGESPLFVASAHGHTEIVRLLLQFNADNSLCNFMKISPLYIACSNGNKEIVKVLLENKADNTQFNVIPNTPLHIASEKGYSNIVELLLNYDADIDTFNDKHQTPLYLAALHGQIETVSILLSKKANHELTDDSKMAPLHVASKTGHFKIVELLLEHNADPNKKALYNNTSLYIAVNGNRFGIVQKLLEKSANPNLCTFGKVSPLYVATQNNNPDIARLLLIKGADPNISCAMENTAPLHLACRKGYLDIVRAILEFKDNCDINLCDANNRTPLYIASREGHLSIVEELLNHHAETNITTVAKRTPLFMAALHGFVDIVIKLIEANADLDCVSVDHETALYCACKEGHYKIVEYLLNKNARLNLENTLSPLEAANEGGYNEISQLIEKYQQS